MPGVGLNLLDQSLYNATLSSGAMESSRRFRRAESSSSPERSCAARYPADNTFVAIFNLGLQATGLAVDHVQVLVQRGLVDPT
jgi:hypothetical protein